MLSAELIFTLYCRFFLNASVRTITIDDRVVNVNS